MGLSKGKSDNVFGQRRKQPKMFRDGLYARVSTNDQQTLPMQSRALREYDRNSYLAEKDLRALHAREQAHAEAEAEAIQKGAEARRQQGDRMASDALRVKRLARYDASLLIRESSISGKNERYLERTPLRAEVNKNSWYCYQVFPRDAAVRLAVRSGSSHNRPESYHGSICHLSRQS
jgi:hypothetical protein